MREVWDGALLMFNRLADFVHVAGDRLSICIRLRNDVLMFLVRCGCQVLGLALIRGVGTRQLLLLPTAGRAPWCCRADSSLVGSKVVGSCVELCSSLSFAAIFLAVAGPPRGLSLCGILARADHGNNMHEV